MSLFLKLEQLLIIGEYHLNTRTSCEISNGLLHYFEHVSFCQPFFLNVPFDPLKISENSWCFQGNQKGTFGRKGLRTSTCELINWFTHFMFYWPPSLHPENIRKTLFLRGCKKRLVAWNGFTLSKIFRLSQQ